MGLGLSRKQRERRKGVHQRPSSEQDIFTEPTILKEESPGRRQTIGLPFQLRTSYSELDYGGAIPTRERNSSDNIYEEHKHFVRKERSLTSSDPLLCGESYLPNQRDSTSSGFECVRAVRSYHTSVIHTDDDKKRLQKLNRSITIPIPQHLSLSSFDSSFDLPLLSSPRSETSFANSVQSGPSGSCTDDEKMAFLFSQLKNDYEDNEEQYDIEESEYGQRRVSFVPHMRRSISLPTSNSSGPEWSDFSDVDNDDNDKSWLNWDAKRQKEGHQISRMDCLSEGNPETKNLKRKGNEMEKILYSVEFIDCAGLCTRSVNSHEYTTEYTPEVIPTDSSLDQLNSWINTCSAKVALSRSLRCPCITSALCVFLTISIKQFLLHGNIRKWTLNLLIQHSIDCGNYILFAELVRNYLFASTNTFACQFDEYLEFKTFFQQNEDISRIAVDVFLLIAKHHFLKENKSLRQLYFNLLLCHSYIDNQLVIIFGFKSIIDTNIDIPKSFLGFDLVLYKYQQQSKESILIFQKIAASPFKEKLPTITEHIARALFVHHSNLFMISASTNKSLGYSSGNHRLEQKICINLFCQHKGYIPYGENKFPTKLGDYETDVLDGYCSFGMDNSLEMGGHIRRTGGSSGSIGGFVNLPNGNTGLITCAHVLFTQEELLCRTFTNVDVEAFEKRSHSFQMCGKVVDAKFPICMKAPERFLLPSIHCDGIDAAIVQLVPSIKAFGLMAVPVEQLRSAGFDPENPPVFAGKTFTVPIPDLNNHFDLQNINERFQQISNSVIKYGAATGFTIGDLYFNRAHARFVDEQVCFYGTDIGALMYNQIEIQNLPQGEFFKMGDSGSFVFCINPDKTVSCIGMAIGLSARGSCLVTPIDKILHSFGLPLTLLPCSPFLSNHPTYPQRQPDQSFQSIDASTILASLETIKSSIMGIQIQLSALDRKVQEIDENRKT